MPLKLEREQRARNLKPIYTADQDAEADLSRHHQRCASVDTNAQLDDSPARVQDPLR